MNFYVVLTVCFEILLINHRKYSKKAGLQISFILCFLSACRGDNVGRDTAHYTDIAYVERSSNSSINSISDLSDFDMSIELISNFINSIIYQLSLNTRWVIVIYAIIMIAFLYLSCKRLKVSAFYAMAFFVILGFFFYSLQACRQFTAVSVILYAITYLKEGSKRSYYFFFWIMVAIMIHSMSFISILLYLVKIFPLSYSYKKIGWLFFVLSMILTLVKIDFLNQMSILVDSKHISDFMDNYGQTSTSLLSLIGCWVETSCLFYFFMQKKLFDIEKRMTIFDYLFILSLLISGALLQYDGIVERIKYNLIIVQCLYLAHLFENKGIWNFRSNIVVLVYFILRIAKNYNYEIALESDYYLNFI